MNIAIDVVQRFDEGTPTDDAELVRVAQEDAAAFGALYQRYCARIYWYLRARTGTDEDADDLNDDRGVVRGSPHPQHAIHR